VTFHYQVNLPEGELKIGAGQHIGVYFPTDGLMALRFKTVNPKYPLYGSDYIPGSRILSLGEYIKFGYISYLNKISIEFYIRSGNYFINLKNSLSEELLQNK
jgi:hypothetical protein